MTLPKKQFMCGACKKQFSTQKSAEAHARDAHPRAGAAIYQVVSVVPGRPAEEEHRSYADLAVDAEIARSMGERSEHAWLLGEG